MRHLLSALLLALPLADTLKAAQDDRVSATLDRAGKWLAQTPQMFRLGLLQRALDHAGGAAGAATGGAAGDAGTATGAGTAGSVK